jgi:hypothetical protein
MHTHLFRFSFLLCVRYHCRDSPVRQSTSTSRITFQNRDFILSSLPQSSIGIDATASQKLISLMTSTLLPGGKFRFFEGHNWIMLSDDPLRYRWPAMSHFYESQRILKKMSESKLYRESRLSARSPDRRRPSKVILMDIY